MGNILVINMGLKSIRCIVFDFDGTKVASAAQAIKTAINDKCVEQNPDEWWEKGNIVVQKAIREARINKVEYITVTTSASCLVCADEKGDALIPAYMISDKRAERQARKLATMKEFQEVYERTGTDASASLMLPKIMWVKDNMPHIFEQSSYFFTPNDFLVYKLCGVAATDYFNATKYHYLLGEKKYPNSLYKALGIDIAKLPEVKYPGVHVGNIFPGLADVWGINEDAKVILSSYDAICSFIGSGVFKEGEASDVSGTVTVFRALSRKTNISPNPKIYQLPLYQENTHIIGGSNNLGGGLIEWVKQCYYQNDEYPYEIMEKDARESEVGARGLIFLPYLLGERAPVWDDNARGVFFGLERMHTRKDMTRAVFESTGFIGLDMISEIQKAGIDVETVRLSGGLARINLVSQIKADIFNRDVMILSEFETTSTGAAMMALVGQGVFCEIAKAAERFATVRMIIKPDKENHKKYEYMYELYKDTYKNLKQLFRRRMEILEEIRSDREVKIENL